MKNRSAQLSKQLIPFLCRIRAVLQSLDQRSNMIAFFTQFAQQGHRPSLTKDRQHCSSRLPLLPLPHIGQLTGNRPKPQESEGLGVFNNLAAGPSGPGARRHRQRSSPRRGRVSYTGPASCSSVIPIPPCIWTPSLVARIKASEQRALARDTSRGQVTLTGIRGVCRGHHGRATQFNLHENFGRPDA